MRKHPQFFQAALEYTIHRSAKPAGSADIPPARTFFGGMKSWI